MYMLDAGPVVKTAGPQEGMVLKVGSLDLSLQLRSEDEQTDLVRSCIRAVAFVVVSGIPYVDNLHYANWYCAVQLCLSAPDVPGLLDQRRAS